MNIREVAKEYCLNQWAQISKARKESGRSVKDFCKDNGISRKAYFYWQRKLRAVACKGLTESNDSKGIVPAGWVKLNPPNPQSADDGILIEINGCHITVKGNTDLELLKNICSILRSL
jgi:putative transposase